MRDGLDYCRQLRERFHLQANYPPNQPVGLGDYGYLDGEIFRRRGNMRDLGFVFEAELTDAAGSYQLKSPGSVAVTTERGGEGAAEPRASMTVRFESENALLFQASGVRVQRMADLESLEDFLLSHTRAASWESDLYVVTAVHRAARTTVLQAARGGAALKLEARSVDTQILDLGDEEADVNLRASEGMAVEVIGEGNLSPLLELSRLRATLAGELREELDNGAGPAKMRLVTGWRPGGEASGISIDARERAGTGGLGGEEETELFLAEAFGLEVSGFELERAKTVYIPLLQSCYAWANGNENPPMPAGFHEIGRVRAGTEETAELHAGRVLDERAEQAIAHDIRAMMSPAPDAAGEFAEAIPLPDAFGFVVRSAAGDEVIVGIRGTQTPEEWVKNFTAIPNRFNLAPEYGLVHLGFEIMWGRVRQSVLSALASVPEGTRVTVLGHSLGGAMTNLGAVDLLRNSKWKNIDVCTFGGPRTGMLRFRRKYNKNLQMSFRVTNQGDVVPHVPPVLLGWMHAGKEIDVNGKVEKPHSLKAYLAGLERMGGGDETATVEVKPVGVAMGATA
jgi:hypothetical protein